MEKYGIRAGPQVRGWWGASDVKFVLKTADGVGSGGWCQYFGHSPNSFVLRLCLPGFYCCMVFLLTSCVYRGNYTTAGSIERVQLPLRDARIGVLEPRGPFGDPASAEKAYRELRSMLKKCGEAEVLTEDQMNQAAQLPALYGEGLADYHLRFFVEQTDLNYLLYLDIVPGRGEMVSTFPAAIPADREASAFVYIYDLAEGTLLKTVQVNGRLNQRPDLRWYEIEYTEEEIARRALKKALRGVVRYSDCKLR